MSCEHHCILYIVRVVSRRNYRHNMYYAPCMQTFRRFRKQAAAERIAHVQGSSVLMESQNVSRMLPEDAAGAHVILLANSADTFSTLPAFDDDRLTPVDVSEKENSIEAAHDSTFSVYTASFLQAATFCIVNRSRKQWGCVQCHLARRLHCKTVSVNGY